MSIDRRKGHSAKPVAGHGYLSGTARKLACFVVLFLGTLPGGALTLTIGSTNGAPGALAFVPVRVVNFTNISTLQFSMHWDPALISFDGVERFALPTLAFGTNHATAGTLTLSWDDPELLSKSLADGTELFFLRLRLSGNPGVSSPVTINGNPIPVEASDNNLNLIPVTVENGAVIIDLEPPIITTPPQDQTAEVGEEVTFSVVATGTPPLFYEWRKNGFPLGGMTNSSVLLTNVQITTAGDYSVVVTNAAGKATSAVARLTVTIPRDITPPGIIITSPTSGSTLTLTSNTVSLAGIADDNIAVTSVTWTNNRGGSGIATGTNTWIAAGILLQLGENVVTVTAFDAATNTATDTITVTYDLPPDTTPPSVIITSPTSSATLSVTTNTITLAGVADDNVGVTNVIWRNSRGGSGTATGTNTWSVTGIALQSGTNLLTITAHDAANNIGTDTLIVTYTPPPDTTPPVINITTPTNAPTFSISSNRVFLAGVATDNVEVIGVTWFNNRGGSGTATGTTNWSIAAIPLQAGDNGLTVIAIDGAGNSGVDILIVTYTPPDDTTPPVVIITSPTASPTLATATNRISLGGTATDDRSVTAVSWTNDRGGGGAASGTNEWLVVEVLLQTGQNVLTITGIDAAGNEGSDTLTVTYTPPPDTIPPVVNINSPTSEPTLSVSSNSVSLGGTASDEVGVTTVIWSNDRGGNGMASGTNAWSIAGIVLLPGANVITVTAKDAADNGGVDVITITYTPPPDTTPPVANITFPTSEPTLSVTSSSISLAGTATDNVAVTAVTWSNDRGGNGTAAGTNDWSIANISLLPGTNVISITATDSVGNAGMDTLTVTYAPPSDTMPPVVDITFPTSGPTFSASSNTFSLAGTASDNAAVTIVTWNNDRGGSGTATGTNNWSIANISLQVGTNMLTVSAADAAGNIGFDTLAVIYTPPADVSPPVVIITSPTTSPTLSVSNSSLSLAGIADDNVGVTQIVWANNRGGGGAANGGSDWTVDGIVLQIGDNLLTVTASDAAGNSGTDTLTVTYTPPPDTTVPTVAITSPTASPSLVVSNDTVSLAGTASDNVGVTRIIWTNNRGGGGTAVGTTNWSVGNITLQLGENVVTVTANDAAGNTNSDMLAITFIQPTDTALPVVTITTPTSDPTLFVNNNVLALAGTATDNVAVTRVTWSNNRGGTGMATGTTNWTAPGILLQAGENVITLTAFDAATNSNTDVLTVTFNGPTGEVVTVSGKLLYYPASDQRLPDVTINASGSADLNTQTGTNGMYTLGLSLGGSFVVQPLAPAHGPPAAAVTTIDISLLRRHLANAGNLGSPYNLLAADVNGSRTISSADITAIRRLVLGATDTLPSGLWRFVASNHVFENENPWATEIQTNRVYNSLAASLVDEDFYAVKMGDVNGSWTPCDAFSSGPCAAPPSVTNEVTFTVTSHTNRPGDTIPVQVVVENFREVTSIQFTLAWDTTVLRYRTVGGFGLPSLAAGNFNTAQSLAGKLSLSWEEPSGQSMTVADGSAIFTVTFDVVASSLAASRVQIVDVAGGLPAPEVGVGFEPAVFQRQDGYVAVLTDPGPPIDASTINYDVTTFSVSIPTVSGFRYILEHTDSLSGSPQPQWQALPAVVGDGTLKTLIDPSASAQQRFYRLRIELQ